MSQVLGTDARTAPLITEALADVARLRPVLAVDAPVVVDRHDRRLDLRMNAPFGAGTRTKIIAGGCALTDLLTALAAHGAHGVVGRFPDPRRPDLLATVLIQERRSPRKADVLLFAERVRLRARHRPATAAGLHAPIDGLQRNAAAWSVRLAAIPAPTGRGRRLLIWSTDDDRTAWLAAGEASTSVLTQLTTAGAEPIAEVARDPELDAALRRQAGPAAFAHVVVYPGATHSGY